MKKGPTTKIKITLSIVLMIIIYCLFFAVGSQIADDLSNVNDPIEALRFFPGECILLLTLAFGATLLYLRKQIKKLWLRVILMYLAVVNFIGAAYAIVFSVIKFIKF